jgi:hypothetical protein
MAGKRTQGNGTGDGAAQEPAPSQAPPQPTGGTTEQRPTSKEADALLAPMQAAKDVEDAQGFRGVRIDPTPLENYTVSGVTSGAPTPETDESARLAALERRQMPVEQLADKED